MHSIEWKSDYNIGIGIVDEQHQWLVRLYNNIAKSHAANHSIVILGRYMKSLVHYTQFHFSVEEDNLKKINYAEFKSHKAEHDKFVEKVHDYLEDVQAGQISAIPHVLNFLNEWLLNHILYEDKKYVPTWNSQNAILS